MRYKRNKQSLTMMSDTWPTGLGDCQLRLDTYKKGALAFSLSARKDATRGLQEFLEARRDDWREAFPAELADPPHETVNSNLTYPAPAPEIGDATGLADVVERTERMVGAMVPLITEYFDERAHSDGGDDEDDRGRK